MWNAWFLMACFLTFTVPNVYPLTVDQAVNQALQNNPDLLARRLDVEVAQGQLEKAQIPLIANPVMESFVSGKDRPPQEGGGEYTNYGLKLSQEFEIAGQRGLRISLSEKELARLVLEIQDQERVLAFEVKEAFTRVLAAQGKKGLHGQVVRLQEDLLQFTRLKFQAGEAAALEVNLAEVELSKSKKDLLLAEREGLESLLGLQALLGVPPDPSLNIEGDLLSDPLSFPRAGILIKQTPAERPDLKAATLEMDKTKTALELAQRNAIPNILLGGFYNRDEGRNDLGVSLSISIPLFDRKQAERREARVRAAQARVTRAALERTIDRELQESANALTSSQKELALFKKEILEKSLENLALLNLAYREGKIGFFEVRVAQRETVETQFAYLETLGRARRAMNRLERVTGGNSK
ncbi:MAG: TolC family protein [Desulfobacterota bacterium]|nr:TolC family protein [Thermodesulfobacteriota bacterium]